MSEFKLEYLIHSQEELTAVGHALLKAFNSQKVFLFSAEMGVGKTTFIKELCRILGSNDNFSSPTFSIVNTYQSDHGPIYHFDLFRVKDVNELLDLGVEEYLDSGQYCFIEWPDLLEPILPGHVVRISMEMQENKRYIRAL